ncbi:MAG: hypothetical protein AB7I98_18805 [Verrucomicrobiales bacterium]|nr:DUF4013 domain-containing protein [Verrucomicrobiae bacterium]
MNSPSPQLPFGPGEASPSPPGMRWRIASGVNWLFGLGSLLLALAILAVIPVLNFLSLGYLLEASRKVSLAGRLRDGFVGIRKASVLGRIALGTWACLVPSRFLAGLWEDALLIDPSGHSGRWARAAMVVTLVLGLLHLAWAVIRGARLRHFLWPAPLRFLAWIRETGKFTRLRDTTLDYVAGLRLPYYFLLGLQGFLGAFLWMALPLAILIAASGLPPKPAGGLSLIGGGLLALVIMPLPFLQTHFAREGRFRAFFEWGAVRHRFRRAPFAFWIALTMTLALALPLYLFKVELTPEAIAWLPGLVFIVLGFVARLLVGWAYGRSLRREKPSPFFWRWLNRIALIPILAVYVFVVYLTQYISWNGARGLLEQHAFLVPALKFELRR